MAKYAWERVSVSIKVRFTWLLPLVIVYSHLYFGGKNRRKCQISDECSNNERIWLDEMHILKMVVKFFTKLVYCILKKCIVFEKTQIFRFLIKKLFSNNFLIRKRKIWVFSKKNISSNNNLSLLLHSSEIWHFPRFLPPK